MTNCSQAHLPDSLTIETNLDSRRRGNDKGVDTAPVAAHTRICLTLFTLRHILPIGKL